MDSASWHTEPTRPTRARLPPGIRQKWGPPSAVNTWQGSAEPRRSRRCYTSYSATNCGSEGVNASDLVGAGRVVEGCSGSARGDDARRQGCGCWRQWVLTGRVGKEARYALGSRVIVFEKGATTHCARIRIHELEERDEGTEWDSNNNGKDMLYLGCIPIHGKSRQREVETGAGVGAALILERPRGKSGKMLGDNADSLCRQMRNSLRRVRVADGAKASSVMKKSVNAPPTDDRRMDGQTCTNVVLRSTSWIYRRGEW